MSNAFMGLTPDEVQDSFGGPTPSGGQSSAGAAPSSLASLIGTPVSDPGFEDALRGATDAELASALAAVKAMPSRGNKARLRSLSAETWRRAEQKAPPRVADPASGSGRHLASFVLSNESAAHAPPAGSGACLPAPVFAKKSQRALRDGAEAERYNQAWRIADSFDREQRAVLEALDRIERMFGVAVSAGLLPDSLNQTKGGMIDDLKSAVKALGSFDEVMDAICAGDA